MNRVMNFEITISEKIFSFKDNKHIKISNYQDFYLFRYMLEVLFFEKL